MKKTIRKRVVLAVIIQAIAVLVTANSHAQNVLPANGSVGIGTNAPNASSILEIKSTDKGVLFPRMTKAQRDAIASPVQGLIIYQTDNTKGLYMYDGAAWKAVTPAVSNPVRGLNDNLFIGQNAGQDITTGKGNIALGKVALKSNTFPTGNIAIGDSALYKNGAAGNAANTGNENIAVGISTLTANTTGYSNVAIGSYSLNKNTVGTSNTAVGQRSLFSNTTGDYNTATGILTLTKNTTGDFNTALGSQSLSENTTGYRNVAIGHLSQQLNSTGYDNCSLGTESLSDNTSGAGNSAFGYRALTSVKAENANSAFGSGALAQLRIGFSNTGLGYAAFAALDTGTSNTGIGSTVLFNLKAGDRNTAIGYSAGIRLVRGFDNIFIGDHSGTKLQGSISNAVAIGTNATVTQSNTMILGDTAVTSFKVGVGTTIPSAMLESKTTNATAMKGSSTANNGTGTVGEANNGSSSYGVWGKSTNGIAGYFSGNLVYTGMLTNGSDQKLKENIAPLGSVLDKLMQVEVKTYNYKSEYEKMKLAKGKQIGYIAQNLEKVFPTLVVETFDKSADEANPVTYKSVNYIGMIPVLTKALQEQQEQITAKDDVIKELKEEIALIKKTLGLTTSETKETRTGETIVNKAIDFHIQPNPASSTIVVSCESEITSPGKIFILDASGREVLTQQITSSQTTVDVSSLTPGSYIVKLMTGNEITGTQKLIVNK